MTSPYTWTFTTASGPVPTVTSETPAPSASGVMTNSNVTATFNEAVQASSITATNFVLKDPKNNTVPATLAYNSSTNTATLTPSSLLANSTTYTATISGVTDAAGHAMANPFSWSFTTGPAPAVTTCSPAWNATGVAVSSPVTATFNEAVQSGTIGFTLTNPSGSTVAATVAYNSSTNTATLTPSAALANSTTYTATVSGAQDTAGDPMTSPYTWTFTTAASRARPQPSHCCTSRTSSTSGRFEFQTERSDPRVSATAARQSRINPANNSLFAVGTPVRRKSHRRDLDPEFDCQQHQPEQPRSRQRAATVLHRFCHESPTILLTCLTGGPEVIGGLMVDNGQLIGTAFNAYDASGSVTLSHFKLSSLNLASASVSGLYQVGTMGGGFVGGYMTPIPSEWQSSLGAPMLTGQGGIPITGRTSYGPCRVRLRSSQLRLGRDPGYTLRLL